MANISSDNSNKPLASSVDYLTVPHDFTPDINLAYLKKTAMGDDVFVKKICDIFNEKTPQLITSLEASIASGETEKTRVVAHRIKTHFETVGVSWLSEALEQLEAQDTPPKTVIVHERLANFIKNIRESWQYAVDKLHEEGLCK